MKIPGFGWGFLLLLVLLVEGLLGFWSRDFIVPRVYEAKHKEVLKSVLKK